jgi:hypothetical protein
MIEGGMRCEAGQETHRAGRMSCVPHHRGGSLFEASLREAPQDEAFFLMPSITCPHAEERPGPAGAHLSKHALRPMQRILAQPLRFSAYAAVVTSPGRALLRARECRFRRGGAGAGRGPSARHSAGARRAIWR